MGAPHLGMREALVRKQVINGSGQGHVWAELGPQPVAGLSGGPRKRKMLHRRCPIGAQQVKF